MSLLTLLQLENEQIEIVVGAVRDWCAQNGCDVCDGEARRAMTIAITLAIATNPTRTELLESLSKTISGVETWEWPELTPLHPRTFFAPEDVGMIRRLIQEWCRETGNQPNGKEAREAARELAAWFERGASVEHLRQLLASHSVSLGR